MSSEPPQPTLILILGISFSGSTALDVMLDGGGHSVSVGEAYLRYRPWRRAHRALRCACGRPACPVWEALRALPPRRLHAAVAARTGAGFVIDSSKNLAWALDAAGWATRSGMRVAALTTWKEPEAAARSAWERSGDPMFWRGHQLVYHARLEESGLPYRSVCQADLARDPAGTLAAACAAVGMAYRPGQERYWERVHHGVGGGRSIRDRPGEPWAPARDPAWERIWAGVGYEPRDDPEVRALHARLRARDVRTGSGEAVLAGAPVLLRPPFYYRDRLKRAWWRVRPRD